MENNKTFIDKQIQWPEADCDCAIKESVTSYNTEFKKGDRVKVLFGSYTNLHGKVINIDDDGISVLLDMYSYPINFSDEALKLESEVDNELRLEIATRILSRLITKSNYTYAVVDEAVTLTDMLISKINEKK